MMKRLLFSLSLFAFPFSLICLAQSGARQFTVNLTPDGKSNMVAYLPEHPTGRAIPTIRKVARRNKLQVIDLHPVITDAHDMTSDMIHPNDQGAAKMAKTIADAIKKD